MLDSVTNLRSLLKDPSLLVEKAYVAGAWIDADDGSTFEVVNPARGDAISVETVPFSTEIADKIKKEEQDLAQEQQRAQWTKIGAGAAVVLLIAGIGFWVLKRRQEEELEVLALEGGMTAGDVDGDSVSEQAINAIRELTPEEKTRNAELDAIETLSKAKPEEVAMLLKTWLAEE